MRHCISNFIALLAMLAFSSSAFAQPARKSMAGETMYKSKGTHIANEAEGQWKSIGTGKYRDDIITKLYFVEAKEFDVEILENTSKPGFYRIVSPYKNYPSSPAVFDGDTYLEIDASVPDKIYLKQYDTGMDWGAGSMRINSIAYDRLLKEGSLDGAFADGECGSIEDGVITFPVNTLLAQMGDEMGGMWLTANASGKFRLVLPGAPDMDVAITVNGMEEKDGKQYISVGFNIGKECETVKVAMLEGDFTGEMADGIADGTIESQEITASGSVLFPYEKDGIYTFVAVPYYEGKQRRTTYKTEELSYLMVGWKSLGKCVYTEGFFADLEASLDLELDDAVMEVEIQESTDRPGYFRMVDPYGLQYRYSNTSNYDTSRRYYMEIDATTPDKVVIKEMSNGCGLDIGYGLMFLWCNAERWDGDGIHTPEEVAAMYGKRNGNVITFPENSLCVKIPKGRDAWYWANATGKFRIELPEGAGIGGAVAGSKDEAPVEYYNLQGMKVNADNLTSGIYIKKRGSESVKVIIR